MIIFRHLCMVAAVTVSFLSVPHPVSATVQFIKGPTPIANGKATAAGDITVMNDRLAFSLAVESGAPWGVPRVAIVDLAPVQEGKIGMSRIAFADFIPNNWSAWPNTYQKMELVHSSNDKVVLQGERDFGDVTIQTTYTLEDHSDRIHIVTTMTNNGATALKGLRSGLTLWPNSGYLFSVPGLAGVVDGAAKKALSDRVVAYDEDWTIALHAPYFDNVNFSSKDMYLTHDLQPKESRRFEGWLQVGSRGDLAPIVQAEIDRKNLASGMLNGNVKTKQGNSVENAVIVIEKKGIPYAWTLANQGKYSLNLPAGDYQIYATGKGYSQGAAKKITITAGQNITHHFTDLEPPGSLVLNVGDKQTQAPLDARITITEGQKQLVEFLGRKSFFTELDQVGKATLPLAPGKYQLTVATGEGFLTKGENIAVAVQSQKTQNLDVKMNLLFQPQQKGWYASDMHHHADQLEAVTPPEYLARAELAAGLDLLFVSDHDSTVNHQALQSIADARGKVFIPSVELSPSWGHFNVYPLSLGEPLAIDTSTASVDAIFAEARRLGADAIQVNHPYIAYGYFESFNKGVAPGGWNPNFDLLEINSMNPEDDQKVLDRIWEFWNNNQRYYLSAGSDVHDVWIENSGCARVYVHVDEPLTAKSFVGNLKKGHSYVTYGPLIQPNILFGSTQSVQAGEEVALGFDLMSVNGVKQITLIQNGKIVEQKQYKGTNPQERANFPVKVNANTWYSIIVEDAKGKKAYSNPIWLEVKAS